MSPIYEVDCEVECRAVYEVEAQSAEEAESLMAHNRVDPLGPEVVVEIGGVERVNSVREVTA